MSDEIRLLLVDDHQVFRHTVRVCLEALPGFKVVGEACDIREALASAKASPPHVAVVDIDLGQASGLLLARVLRQRFPAIRILILSMHAKPDYVAEARQTGACGYVLKSGPFAEIVKAIEAVMVGGSYYSAGVDRTGMARPALTPAESQVLSLVAQGRSSREIAHRLKKDARTVETQRRSIMDKLGAANAVQMIVLANALGLVDVHGVVPEALPDEG